MSVNSLPAQLRLPDWGGIRLAKKPKKLIVIGIDGLMPEMVRKLVAEGHMPNMARLIEGGTFCEALPSPPCDTPTNWTTLATGAWTGTHGNNTFGVHVPGEPFTVRHDLGKNIFPPFASVADESLSQFSGVEWFWQAASRAGRKCILVNYPGGWPPDRDDIITVDGAGPYCSKLVRLTGPNVFATREAGIGEGENTLHTVRPAGWGDLPASKRDPREFVFVISGEANLEPTGVGWIISREEEAPAQVDPELLYCGLVTASTPAAYDTVLISKGRDARNPVCTLKEGQSSEWITDEFRTKWGPVTAKFRLTLVRLSEDAREIRLHRTTIFNTQGWAHPEGIADGLIDDLLERGLRRGAGGPHESDGTNEDIPRIGPLCQVRESIADQCVGLGLTCEHLAANHEWDVLWTQIHAPDGLNHQALNGICPRSPEYDPDDEEATWQRFRDELSNLDGYVGHVVEHCADDETAVAVISDHGAIPTIKRIWVTHWLREAGLLSYLVNEETGRLELDFHHSKVIVGDHPLAQNIWVNLKGRDPDGIVEAGDEYEQVRSEAIRVLCDIRDPETGQCPVALALRTEDADWLGQWGDKVGDIVYYLAPGYANDVHIHSVGPLDPERLPEGGMDRQTSGQQGVHHCYTPWARFCGCSVRGVFIVAGNGVRGNYERRAPIWTVDVAPTLAHLIGIPAPHDSEGTVAADVLTT